MNLDEIKNEIISRLEKSREWLLVNESGKSFALAADEIEITVEREKVLLSFQSEAGFQTWRVKNHTFANQKILLDLSRNFGAENSKIEFVPRSSSSELSATVEFARFEKAGRMAQLLIEENERAKLIRVALKGENGRLAQIFFENRQGATVFVLHDVSETITPERILTTAILELEKLSRRRKNPVEKVWVLANKSTARNLQKLLALLKQRCRKQIEIFEISRDSGAQNQKLKLLARLKIADLWHAKSSRLAAEENVSLSETARKIITFAPADIDAIFTKRGETLRFQGLPFARLRKFAGAEKAWFGVENKRQVLNEKTFDEFSELIKNLKLYRRFDAPSRRHAFYALAPEAWLEAALRRNVKQLDGNLILSPVYNQFRAGRDKIDLLALRKDGRLVIIELKVSADREMLFQSLDYWRKIEAERRAGNLQRAKIFGDSEIKNQPALVYLVAPMLDFHRDFKFLSEAARAEVEIYRFDLNQNWRENLQVTRRQKV